MQVVQAVIAAGGSATRLNSETLDAAGPKSLMLLRGKTLIEWQLTFLQKAGINRVVIAVDTEPVHDEMTRVMERVNFSSLDIRIVRDHGLGTHGIPTQLAGLLDDEFIFDAGHSFIPPEHYRRIVQAKTSDAWVASSFVLPLMHRDGTRIFVEDREAGFASAIDRRHMAMPYVLDRSYLLEIEQTQFKVASTFRKRIAESKLLVVESSFPPEFDYTEEKQTTYLCARSFLRSSCGRATLKSE